MEIVVRGRTDHLLRVGREVRVARVLDGRRGIRRSCRRRRRSRIGDPGLRFERTRRGVTASATPRDAERDGTEAEPPDEVAPVQPGRLGGRLALGDQPVRSCDDVGQGLRRVRAGATMIEAQPRIPRLFGEDPSRRRLPSSRSSSRGGRRIRRAGSRPRSPDEWRKGCETGVSPGSTATCTPQQLPWSSPRPRPLATMPLAITHGPVRPVRPFVSRSSRGCPDGPGPGTRHPPRHSRRSHVRK